MTIRGPAAGWSLAAPPLLARGDMCAARRRGRGRTCTSFCCPTPSATPSPSRNNRSVPLLYAWRCSRRLLSPVEEAEHHFAIASERCRLLGARAILPRVLHEHAGMLLAAVRRRRRGSCPASARGSTPHLRGAPDVGCARADRRHVATERAQRGPRRSALPQRGRLLGNRLRAAAPFVSATSKDCTTSRCCSAARSRAARARAGPSRRGSSARARRTARTCRRALRSRCSTHRRRTRIAAGCAELSDDLEEAREWDDPERIALTEIGDRRGDRPADAGGRSRWPRPSSRHPQKGARERDQRNPVAVKAIGTTQHSARLHLDASIRTGRFCSYAPPGELPPDWHPLGRQ